jgi:hypothetical protein
MFVIDIFHLVFTQLKPIGKWSYIKIPRNVISKIKNYN